MSNTYGSKVPFFAVPDIMKILAARYLKIINETYQNNHTLKNSRGIESDVQDIIDQLIELFWGQLVEYTAHLK